MCIHLRTIFFATLCLVIARVGFTEAQTGDYATVVRQGDVAPDGSSLLDQFSDCSLNNVGQFLINATLTNTPNFPNDVRALYLWNEGQLRKVVREDDFSPDGNGNFDSFGGIFNDNAQVIVNATMRNTNGGSFDDTGIFTYDGGIIAGFVREGDQEPDRPNQTLNSFLETRLNQSGDFSVLWENDNHDVSIYAFDRSANSGRFVVTSGDSAPDMNGVFIDVSSSRLNDAMNVAFKGRLGMTNKGIADDEGVYLDKGGSLFQIAREGQVVSGSTLGSFSQLGLNDIGLVAFQTTLDGTDDNGLFVANENNVQRFVMTGMAAAGGNGFYNTFDFHPETAFNDVGRIAYLATLTETDNGSLDDQGIFRSSINGTTLIASKGETVMGFGTITGFGDLRMNETSAVAYEASTSVSDLILVGDVDETVFVVSNGQKIDGDTINDVQLTGLNDMGQVSYKATNQDGDSIIQLWTPDLHWRLDGTGFWEDFSRWTLGVKPAFVHDVFIQPDQPTTIFGPENDTGIKSLTIGERNRDIEILFDLDPRGVLAADEFISVAEEATLRGSGFIRTPELNVFGEVAPDSFIEVEGNVFFGIDSLYSVDVGSTADQIIVSGNVDLAGLLDLNIVDGNYLVGDFFTIIDVGGFLTGEFDGLGENDLAGTFENYRFFVTYQAGDGNNVALRVAVPEPSSLAIFGLLAILVPRPKRQVTYRVSSQK